MNTKQKEYIEQNIDLIENNNWNEFFRNSPDGIGNVLYRSGIDFMLEMKAVPEACFKNSEIDSITIPEGVTTIGVGAFTGCTGLTSITIPDSVTSIGNFAFTDCTSLTSITIPDSVTSIDNYTFFGCTGLTSITIPDSITDIGDYAFWDCISLTSITIPNSVTNIGSDAFRNCTSLESVTIPDSVTHIGVLTFYGCSNLKSITIPASVKNIVEGAFCNLGKNVHIQFNGTKDEWKNIYQTSSFEKTYFTVTCLDGKIVKKAS